MKNNNKKAKSMISLIVAVIVVMSLILVLLLSNKDESIIPDSTPPTGETDLEPTDASPEEIPPEPQYECPVREFNLWTSIGDRFEDLERVDIERYCSLKILTEIVDKPETYKSRVGEITFDDIGGKFQYWDEQVVFYLAALKTNDPSLCEKLDKGIGRSSCYASLGNDKTLCENNIDVQEECKTLKDDKVCEGNNWKYTCLSLAEEDSSYCLQSTDPECEQYLRYDLAIKSQNPELCPWDAELKTGIECKLFSGGLGEMDDYETCMDSYQYFNAKRESNKLLCRDIKDAALLEECKNCADN